jgi:hypothetical protein
MKITLKRKMNIIRDIGGTNDEKKDHQDLIPLISTVQYSSFESDRTLNLQEEAEARQLGIELLKPGDRAELVLGTTRKEEQLEHAQKKMTIEDNSSKSDDSTDGREQPDSSFKKGGYN